MSAPSSTARKYSYWMDGASLGRLKNHLRTTGTEMAGAQYSPCEALRGDIGFAEPSVWPVICAPDATPWYESSRFAGLVLVVSSFPLGGDFERFLETTIEPVAFQPAAMPGVGERTVLSADAAYRAREPALWSSFPAEWSDEMARGFARMTKGSVSAFDDILCRWRAVHANFMNPRYRAGEEFSHAPYSVDASTCISTCCVELFNLLDAPEKVLLVRPCIGAVIAEVLDQDRYYLVRLVKNGGS